MMKILIIGFAIFIVGFNCQKRLEPSKDSCENSPCKEGEECVNGKCQCVDTCPEEWNNFPRQLCIDGKTYRHECDFWRNKCYCKRSDKRCGGKEFDNHQAKEDSIIHYFDACRDLTAQCDWKSEEATFHERLAVWLRDLYSQKWSTASENTVYASLLSPMSLKSRSSASNLFNQQTNSKYGGYVSFWFCDMDKNNNGALEKGELSLLSQMLNPSTPCLSTFLSKCGSGSITSAQWNTCFKIPKGEEVACSKFT